MKGEDVLIRKIKDMIDHHDIYEIERIYKEELADNTNHYNVGYIYQKVYLHACLKQRHGIVEFLRPLYKLLPVIDQIEIRPMFRYADMLLQKQQKWANS